MPDAKIIPFPDGKNERGNEAFVQMRVSGNVPFDWQSNCSEHIHHFDSVPGECRCGQNYWDPSETSAPT